MIKKSTNWNIKSRYVFKKYKKDQEHIFNCKRLGKVYIAPVEMGGKNGLAIYINTQSLEGLKKLKNQNGRYLILNIR